MNILISFIIPLALCVVVLLMPRVRIWLDGRAELARQRTKDVEEFHRAAMRFMKSTDAVKHENLRKLTKFLANAMMHDTSLVRMLIVASKPDRTSSKERSGDLSDEIETLSDNQRQELAKIMGLSLLISSANSLFLCNLYRGILALAINSAKEAREPEQLVYRFRGVQKPHHSAVTVAC